MGELRENVDERFAVLSIHAQNFIGPNATSSMDILWKMINDLRMPESVFLTCGELHQVHTRGWSAEVWANHIALRNYRATPVKLLLPSPAQLGSRNAQNTPFLEVHTEARFWCVRLGSNWTIPSGGVHRIYSRSVPC
eukprot:NODE_6071_length_533_cov_43.541322_g5317_i0.p1 GENE.NODE_6071_length_533_cov_43.541322_g5317_i0~~NODE_6071_length_533_cov_43.541322_g5317_i0.p1  ORF type:complete len:137 (-),score=18.21 NODE_6071_length_533_cov_43.541322_g5317_i0:91-501(-)